MKIVLQEICHRQARQAQDALDEVHCRRNNRGQTHSHLPTVTKGIKHELWQMQIEALVPAPSAMATSSGDTSSPAIRSCLRLDLLLPLCLTGFASKSMSRCWFFRSVLSCDLCSGTALLRSCMLDKVRRLRIDDLNRLCVGHATCLVAAARDLSGWAMSLKCSLDCSSF